MKEGSKLSFDDPFSEEAQVEVPPAVEPVVVKSEAVGDGEGKIVSTYKEGAGFDSSWTVVHAASVEDWFAIHDNPRFKELLEKQKKVAAFFRGGAPAAAAARPAGTPQQAQEAPSWAPEKPYADFVYKTGVSKKSGSTWHAWMPPQQGDSRKAVFFNAPR